MLQRAVDADTDKHGTAKLRRCKRRFVGNRVNDQILDRRTADKVEETRTLTVGKGNVRDGVIATIVRTLERQGREGRRVLLTNSTDTRERASARHVDVGRLLEGFAGRCNSSINALAEHVEVIRVINRVRAVDGIAEVVGPGVDCISGVNVAVIRSGRGHRLGRAVGVREGKRDSFATRETRNRERRGLTRDRNRRTSVDRVRHRRDARRPREREVECGSRIARRLLGPDDVVKSTRTLEADGLDSRRSGRTKEACKKRSIQEIIFVLRILSILQVV